MNRRTAELTYHGRYDAGAAQTKIPVFVHGMNDLGWIVEARQGCIYDTFVEEWMNTFGCGSIFIVPLSAIRFTDSISS